MNVAYGELAERIRGELSELERVIRRSQDSWARVSNTSESAAAYLDSVALGLHGLYTGLEKLFALIASEVDRQVPAGANWRRDLLRQLAEDRAIRPAVIGASTVSSLDELRRFRHLVRNAYNLELVPERVAVLMEGLAEKWAILRAELDAFAAFLESMADER